MALNTISPKKIKYFLFIMVVVTTITYRNHFDNSFHFDDFHTITENPHIRSLKNIPSFFVDATTFSSIPQNQSYRPIVTTSLAIDYWLSKGYDPFYYHVSSFLLFLCQGFLIFLFVYKMLSLSFKNKFNFYSSSGIALWYLLHPVMAETINYVISRSDLQSTFFVVLAFVLYQYSARAKKYHLYLLPVLLGALAKPPAIMFAPMFFCYLVLIEEKMSLFSIFSKTEFPKIKKILLQTLPAILLCIGLYFFISYMMPSTFVPGGSSVFNYMITQPFVLFYYFGSSLFPIHLSADTDWIPLKSMWSLKFFIGIFFVIALVWVAFITSKTKKYSPISFGITWFFLALVPTSSIIPLAEVMNDHRMYFPFVGLLLSVGWAMALLLLRLKEKFTINSTILAAGMSVVLLGYAYGTYARNRVWQSEETLWQDVTIKSPKNGRGLMNYGLTLMAKGNYDTAEKYFLKAREFTPQYYTLDINLGILNKAQGDVAKAEKHFKDAVHHGAGYYTPWYYYGQFLTHASRNEEAIQKLSRSLEISPSHMSTRLLLMENYQKLEQWDKLHELATASLQIDSQNARIASFLQASVERESLLATEEKKIDAAPDANAYLQLSLKYYHKKNYKKTIAISKKALLLNPDFHEVYNNMCSSYTQLGSYEKAIENCTKALALKPDFQLAKNNLHEARNKKKRTHQLIDLTKNNVHPDSYLNLSLQYYNEKLYQKCIQIAQEGLLKHPSSDNLYNNMCAAYNSLKNWNAAAAAGEKGLAINPDNQLLRNNYNLALKNKK